MIGVQLRYFVDIHDLSIVLYCDILIFTKFSQIAQNKSPRKDNLDKLEIENRRLHMLHCLFTQRL